MRLKIFTPLFLLINFISFHAYSQLNVELLGHLEYVDQLSNITGWADGAGNEYAIVGTYDGTSIVDVTDPTTPVEVQFIDGNNSIWREVRTWNNYAYVVSEAGGGLLCIDLSDLPASAPFNYTDCGIGVVSGHTVFADENGFVHIFGSNIGNGGDQMFDASANPMDPEFVGEADTWYIHDAFVRGDTLWAGNIYNGWFSIWDISDKTSPLLLGQQSTPYAFTHNTWLTDDNKFIFTTDEVTNATVAAYDVSDVTDIKELDQFRANPGTNSIPHNVMVYGDFLVTAYYRDGVIITDATYPDNLIKTGEYDTSPLTGGGFDGCWGSWPYLPSGNIIAADMQEGLFILGPTYVQACYVEGMVTDISTGSPINGVEVSFTAVGAIDEITNISGEFKGGIYAAGLYDFTFTKIGYDPLTVTDVSLTNGVITYVNVEMSPLATYVITGQVIDEATGFGIPNADVLFQNATYEFQTIADASGNFTFPSMFDDTYTLYAGEWKYVTNSVEVDVNPGGVYIIELATGYYDDFIFDNFWDVSGTVDVGIWERGEPYGTFSDGGYSNPEFDLGSDYGDKAYVTGNLNASGVGDDDVDNGYTNLVSPEMDLTGYFDPKLSYSRWFYNGGGTGDPNDTLRVFVGNGIEEILIDAINGSSPDLAEWIPIEINIKDYLEMTENMTVRFRTADQSATGHLVEAGVDKFFVTDDVTSAPTAAFTSDITSGCAPLTINFDDNSVGAASWSWTFEGGTPSSSTLQNPTVIYTVPGTYAVTLVATNIIGTDESTTDNYVSAELCNSIEDENISDMISVLPNPFNNTTEIFVQSVTGSEQLTVTDITGRIVLSIDLDQNAKNIIFGEGLATGIYYINLIKNNISIGAIEVVKAK